MKRRIADNIIDTLGGQRFKAITGVREIVKEPNGLRMTVPKNRSGANRLKIRLKSNGLYKVIFYKYIAPRKVKDSLEYTEEKVEEKAIFDDVYFEELQNIFIQVTGLFE